MKLTTVANAISVAATRLGIAASAQVNGIAANASVSAIQLVYELGFWVIRLNKLDPVGIEDGSGVLGELFVRFFKSRIDNAAVAEAIALDLHKALKDGAGLTDKKILGFFKALQDPAVVREAHAFSMTKPLADGYAAAEHATKGLYKALVDSAGFGDHEVRSFFKALSERPVAVDKLAMNLAKPLPDQMASATDKKALGLNKALNDQLFATDDIDGAASILDDQNMQFVKSVSDMVGMTDLIYVVIVILRDFSDVFVATDRLSNYLAKPFADAAAASDGYIKLHPNKGIFDAAGFLEQNQKTFGKSLADNPAVTEARSVSLASVRTESARVSDNGLVRNQSYCDFGYFSEDYFGSSKTF